MRLLLTFLLSLLCIGSSAQSKNKSLLKEGEKRYNQYGCVSCHGKAGKLTSDLTQAYKKYTDDELKKYISNARDFGNSQMPVYKDIIQDKDYSYLISYVRVLGEKSERKK